MRPVSRRSVIAAAPAVGLAGLLGGCATSTVPAGAAGAAGAAADIYRTDDRAKIIAAARAIVEEDHIGTLITVDANGVPRARPVGIWPLEERDLVMWIGTRRQSRKVDQIGANPNATIIFNFDDLAGNYAKAFYASFMGRAFVHTDEATLAVKRPSEDLRRELWPNFPDDYASIRFEPSRLEVFGKGVSPSKETWQPQGIIL